MKIKIKIPKVFRAKRKLRATATRRPLRIAAATNYEEITEPNMKLSRALLIVLLLHVVAVTGILAFNAIKTRQAAPTDGVTAATNPANQTARLTKPGETSSSTTVVSVAETKPSRTLAKPPDKDSKLPAAAGKTYVVVKGDNPVTIAKKFKVSYDDLLALNHIDDPRKLKIGQKLLLPVKAAKGKRDE